MPAATPLSPTGAFTVEAWVKLTANNVKQVIASNRNTGTAGWELRTNAAGQVVFAIYHGMGGTNVQSVGTVAKGSWVHVAGCYTGSEISVSVNGVVVKAPVTYAMVASNTALQIGRSSVGSTSTDFLQGRVDELRISDGALYTATAAAPSAPLQVILSGDYKTRALWHMDENTGTAINDAVTANGVTTQGTLNGSATWGYGKTNPLGKRKRRRQQATEVVEAAAGPSAQAPGGWQSAGEESQSVTAGTASLATTSGWVQQYVYDRFGNRTWGAQTTLKASDVTIAQATNRLATSGSGTAVGYDTAGNMTSETVGSSARTYSYTADNRMWQAVAGGVTTTYGYDADGRRVKKTSGTTVTRFIYNAGGVLVAEYTGATPTLAKEYAYGASGLLAAIDIGGIDPGPKYLTPDHLGTPRIATNGTGGVKSRHDYLPFGEEIAAIPSTGRAASGYAVADGVRQQFGPRERVPLNRPRRALNRFLRRMSDRNPGVAASEVRAKVMRNS